MFQKSSLLNKTAYCCYFIYHNPVTWLMLLLLKLKRKIKKTTEHVSLLFDFFTAT